MRLIRCALLGAVFAFAPRAFLVRDKANDATRRKIVGLSKDAAAITPPVGSPIDLGATLTIFNPSSLESPTFVLPAGPDDGSSGWRGLGRLPGVKGASTSTATSQTRCARWS